MFSNNDKVFRTTGEVVFDGTIKSYIEICNMLGFEPVSNIWRYKQSADGNRMIVYGDTIARCGDVVSVIDEDVSIIRRDKL